MTRRVCGLIDNKAGIIVDAEGTRANRVVEISVTRTMIERVGRRFGLQPQRLAGDTVYGAQRHSKSNGRMGCTSNNGSISLE
jgi:hypothetical protein